MSDASPVFIFRMWDTRTTRISTPLDDGRTRHENRAATLCGLITYAWGWTENPDAAPGDRTTDYWDRTSTATRIRRDHAEQIGRPCARCDAIDQATQP